MPPIVVRPPRPEDAAPLAEIWIDHAEYYTAMDSDSFRVPARKGLAEWLEEQIREPLGDDELSLVAEVEDLIVGFAEAKIVEPMEDADRQLVVEVGQRRLSINAFGVRPSHWRRGIGSKLLAATEKWGQERGADVSCLDTYARSPVAVPFYEKLGYTVKSVNYRKRLT
jgi:GNAT superfamily N-acetyltransferase